MNFKNKRVLITAGPAWVAIDKARVISNIASAETGILLTKVLKKNNAKVTLLLGPAEVTHIPPDKRILRFRYFDDLKRLLIKELKSGCYDALIHTAAVPDYKPARKYSYKISSGITDFSLKLRPTEKIINLVKKITPDIFLVGFKFEPDINNRVKLISKAKRLMNTSKADMVVANTLYKNRYLAYIVSIRKVYGPFISKEGMANSLITLLHLRGGEKLKRIPPTRWGRG